MLRAVFSSSPSVPFIPIAILSSVPFAGSRLTLRKGRRLARLKAGRPTDLPAQGGPDRPRKSGCMGGLHGSIAALSRRELSVGRRAGNVWLTVFTGESVPSPRHFLQCFLVFFRHLRGHCSAKLA
jgi:hypothetical protein